ncbi:DUF1761 domain-containing protein [Candidatus Saccharibacteria bacterium]|nr:MAG: DUF1761 domain-containing protein [Candidatus Saccharibacteria bacterium]
MSINLGVVALASMAQFIVGAAWYTFVFGKQWGEMFGFDKLSKKDQKEMQSKMGPYYGLQLFVTLMTSYVLALFIADNPDSSEFVIALWLWVGFVVPTQVSAVIFGGVHARWIQRRIAIMAGGSLVCLMVAAWIFSLFA